MKRTIKQFGPLMLCALLSAVLAVFLYRWIVPPQKIVIRETTAARYTNLEPDPLLSPTRRTFLSTAPTEFTSAAEAVTPSVVNIKTVQGGGAFDFLGGGSSYGANSGSGVVISPDGYIVTNNHVIEGDEIYVTLNNKREFKASIIGTDPSTDLALIKIKAQNLPYLIFGDSDSLRIGEWVLAVGNPFNLESTVTAGIVSAKGRSIDILEGQDRIESFIQTDAAVNPGNSGGALVNTNGELVGINTAIITRSGRYEGYSFAVPANLVRKVIRDLRDYGMVQRALLGVFIKEIDNRRAKNLGLEKVQGVYIESVTPGSGADDAGLKKGDVIVSINGVNTYSMPEMQELVGRYRPGNTITVTYIRKGKRYDANVVLKNKSNNTQLYNARDDDLLVELGFELRNLTQKERNRYPEPGVKVVSILRGSRIERTNMAPGFVITHINAQSVEDVEEAIHLLQSAPDKVVMEGIYDNQSDEYDKYFYEFSVK